MAFIIGFWLVKIYWMAINPLIVFQILLTQIWNIGLLEHTEN